MKTTINMKVKVNDQDALASELKRINCHLLTAKSILDDCYQIENDFSIEYWSEESMIGKIGEIPSELDIDKQNRVYRDWCTVRRFADGWYVTKVERIIKGRLA